MKNYDLTNILKDEHSGKWVALNRDRTEVIKFSDNLDELMKKVGKLDVVYMRVLPRGVSFSF